VVEEKPSLRTETAAREVELCQLDLRYEGYRMKNPGLEERLLGSISQRGMEAPLEGVEVEEVNILLNGFKRYRCAHKLQLRMAPYVSLGQDEVSGIVNLLRISNTKALGILEQAAFIDELKNTRHLSLADIAEQLSRSKSWVSMRVGLIAQMSLTVRAQLFSGAFPAYSYLYILRRFMRMNGVTGEQMDQFVTAVSGKKLSVREIEQLAHGYFRGPESFRQEILKGNLALPLKQIAEVPQSLDGCSEFERVLLHDLELTQKYMQRMTGKSQDPRLQSRAFHAQANLLTAGILSRVPAFTQNLKQLHDRSGKA
jgi:predicted transcriptional regulator